MPWIPMYLYNADIRFLLDHLNDDSEVAFIVPVGIAEVDHQWVAIPKVEDITNGKHMLWHVPSGPLSMPGRGYEDPDLPISNPWKGWREIRPGADPAVPFFSSHPGTIELALHERGLGDVKRYISPNERTDYIIGMSSFGWIGQRYRSIGMPASAATERWWRRLRRWVAKNSRRIPRVGPLDGPEPEIYAFPSAFQVIAQGKPRDANPL